ncbi:CGNR zinc finger domain-containing protein [Amycolatopsis jiangsuensis]|uniref:Putative RNA-binding Zn ribbon-like protein n=1 Tax=Amycolatopsis jiangsuensis TaxID=1181879 RepID=A0A840IQN8_9PSEU|nr:CGNR zinc finger domain-containing protein [Amycolatopsis jiangsuensis]MBB4684210.1 putative RNA-binding Zn ribbon-like protein [Amycolatopsis jiangsuensis]
MNFDSHTSTVVAAAVLAVNALTPGYARGREYSADDPGAQLSDLTPRSGRTRAREVSTADIEQLREYAVRLREVFAAVDEGRVDDACERINTLLRDTHAAPVLARHDDEPWHLHFHAVDAEWARSWAAPMATGLAFVLGTTDRDRLGVCTAVACDRVFVDVSRNGTRRFCSTACQNRVKAAAFRARQRD